MAAITTIKSLGKRNDLLKIKGVSFCGQMHGLVVLDKDDKVIRPALL
jgi:xylulokinase